MAIPLIINGVTFQYPQQFDKNWGPTLTNWSSAVTSGMLQKAGGSFPLTTEVDFGGSFGMKVLSIKSEESNIATTGFIRLANASTGIVWRNALHNADLPLTVNSSNQLTFNGVSVGATTSLTNSHILVGNVSNQPADVALSGDAAITNAGVLTLTSGIIVNATVNASAAIALSKLAALTASKLAVTDGSGVLTTTSSPTLTELGYVGGVTSAIQTQLNTITSGFLSLTGGTMTGVINMGSHKIISVTNGSSASDAVAFGQLVTNNITGTTTNDSAASGKLGEYIESIASDTAAPTSTHFGDLTSISLTAGDWDVSAFTYAQVATGTWTVARSGISTTSGDSSVGLALGSNEALIQFSPANTIFNVTLAVPPYRVSLASTTIVYLKMSSTYSIAQPQFRGRLSARRAR